MYVDVLVFEKCDRLQIELRFKLLYQINVIFICLLGIAISVSSVAILVVSLVHILGEFFGLIAPINSYSTVEIIVFSLCVVFAIVCGCVGIYYPFQTLRYYSQRKAIASLVITLREVNIWQKEFTIIEVKQHHYNYQVRNVSQAIIHSATVARKVRYGYRYDKVNSCLIETIRNDKVCKFGYYCSLDSKETALIISKVNCFLEKIRQ